jgi:hypothetical protein
VPGTGDHAEPQEDEPVLYFVRNMERGAVKMYSLDFLGQEHQVCEEEDV